MIDERLQYGSGMRVQRFVEALFLIAALFTSDMRFAVVTLGLSILQTLSPRLVPIALVVALVERPRPRSVSDLYFDLGGTRGACAISVVVQTAALLLVHGGHRVPGLLLLAVPTASFLLSGTVGFCAGCAIYVMGREMLARFGLLERFAEGAADVDVVEKTSHRQ